MKKLILVTLTAFAASWLLAEARREVMQPPLPPPPPLFVIDDRVPIRPPVPLPETPDDSNSIRTVPWNAANVFQKDPEPTPAPASKPSPKRSTKPAVPSWFPKTELDEPAKARPDDSGARVVVGRVSSSEERARTDLRLAVERAVTDWLAADVATSWKVPENVLGSMVQASYTQETLRNLIGPEAGSPKSENPGFDGIYTLYRAGQKLDFSPSRKAQIIAMYRHDLATQRLQRLGGGLALALATLAVLSGYIKADEATKGYYTNRLRFVAAAGLGAAGVVAYRLWV
jgi:hypothetical protein